MPIRTSVAEATGLAAVLKLQPSSWSGFVSCCQSRRQGQKLFLHRGIVLRSGRGCGQRIAFHGLIAVLRCMQNGDAGGGGSRLPRRGAVVAGRPTGRQAGWPSVGGVRAGLPHHRPGRCRGALPEPQDPAVRLPPGAPPLDMCLWMRSAFPPTLTLRRPDTRSHLSMQGWPLFDTCYIPLLHPQPDPRPGHMLVLRSARRWVRSSVGSSAHELALRSLMPSAVAASSCVRCQYRLLCLTKRTISEPEVGRAQSRTGSWRARRRRHARCWARRCCWPSWRPPGRYTARRTPTHRSSWRKCAAYHGLGPQLLPNVQQHCKFVYPESAGHDGLRGLCASSLLRCVRLQTRKPCSHVHLLR